MSIAKTLHRQVAVAVLATGVVVLTMGTASAQRGGTFDLINRPAAPTGAAPFSCWVDEGYGRFSACENGNGGG